MTGRMRVSLQDGSRNNTLLEYQSTKRETPLCHEYSHTLRENNCLQVVFTASYQNPNSLQKDNAFRVNFLLSHALMDMKLNKQTVSESSPNQSARQHKETYNWVVTSLKFLYYSFQRQTGEMYYENKGRKRKREFAGIWEITFSVSAGLFRSSFIFLQTKSELDLKLLEVCELWWWPSLLLLWFY